MILHPHPQAGGTMNDRISLALYKTFANRGFATLRYQWLFNGKDIPGASNSSFTVSNATLSRAPCRSTWFGSRNRRLIP